MECDYVVIGAGSAGCVLAGRLSEDAAVQVALLEAGPRDDSALLQCPGGQAVVVPHPVFNWAFETVAQPGLAGRKGYQPRGRVLGGSSSIDAMVYVRGQPADFDRWAALGNWGWDWASVLPYFMRAENNAAGADRWHGDQGPLRVGELPQLNSFSRAFVQACQQGGLARNADFNGLDQEGAGYYQLTQHAGERCSAAKAYLTPHLGRPNLQLHTGTRVTRILFEGVRAIGVEWMEGSEPKRLYARREVLLCAGALQSPQLLMLSGVGDQAQLQPLGIPVVHHLPGVGQQLHDHPSVGLCVDLPQQPRLMGVSMQSIGPLVRSVWDWMQRREGLLTTNFAEAGAFFRSHADEPAPDLQIHFLVTKQMDHGRRLPWGHGYSARVSLLQPRSRGQVRLASSKPEDPPLIDPQYLADPEDMRRLVRGFRRMRSILQEPALACFGGTILPEGAKALDEEALEAYIRTHADTSYHPVGTCRMGAEDEGSVVNSVLCVHGLQGLRVVDASVMPQITSGDTNAPTVMVAERVVEWIREGIFVSQEEPEIEASEETMVSGEGETSKNA